MKKIIMILVSLATISFVSATNITVGGRESIGLGIGTTIEDGAKDSGFGELKLSDSFDYGITAFGKIDVAGGFAMQSELSFDVIYTGLKGSSGEAKAALNVISFAALAMYDIALGNRITLSPFAGPQVGYVLGKVKMSGDLEESCKVKEPMIFDLVFGTAGAYKTGNGALLADIRYNFGLTTITNKSADSKLYTPKNLILGLGYQIRL